jgi:cytidylate kinase
MVAITISSELGSGGRDIAQQVAATLGYTLVDKTTTDEILRQYGLTKFEDLYNSVPSLLDLINVDNLTIVSMANEIVEALAQRGAIVILGRTGFAVLGDYADVLHVRITAPMPERAQRVMTREGLADLHEAEVRVLEDDILHRTYVERLYNKQWDEPANFDLNVDTAALPGDLAVQQIVEASKALAKAGDTTATIEVDPVLADAIAKVIAEEGGSGGPTSS